MLTARPAPQPLSPVYLLETLRELAPAGIHVEHELMRDTATQELMVVISFAPSAARSTESDSWFALPTITPPDTTTIQAITECLIERSNPAHALTLLLDHKAECGNGSAQTTWCNHLTRAIVTHLSNLIDLAEQELDSCLPTTALANTPTRTAPRSSGNSAEAV